MRRDPRLTLHARRLARRLPVALSLLAVLITIMVILEPAHADPPPTSPPAPAAGTPTPTPSPPMPGPRGPILPPGQRPTPAPPSQPAAPIPQPPAPGPAPSTEDKPSSNRLLDAILGKQGRLPGEYPLSHYDIGYSSGGLFGGFRPSAILGWLTDITFTAARWLTAFAIWAINYALTFGIARLLIDPAAQVATDYQHAVQHTGLAWAFLVLAVGYAGWHALRGRLAHGVGEALISFLIATLLAGILAAPAATLLGNNGLLDRTGDISLALAGITLNPDQTDTRHGATATQISAPMLAKLQHTLVGVPHQILNWGEVLEGPHGKPQCHKTYRHLLDDGPWGDSDKPREEMKAAGCTKQAAFNKRGSADRLIAALLVLLAVLLACVLLVLMACTVVAAQIIMALLACFAPLALAAGLLPGTGRQVLWRWAGAVLRTLAGVVMTIAALSVVITLATAILRADADMPLAVRMALLDILMITAFLFRRRLLEAGRRAATGIGHRLETIRLGGGHRAGILPAGSAVAAAEAWGRHHQRALGMRARHELRQLAHTRRLTRAVHNAHAPRSSTRGGTASRTRRALHVTGKTAALAAAATLGAPVYLPRAAKAATTASKAKTAALHTRLATASRAASAFGHEYLHNLTAPVRAAAAVVHKADTRPNRRTTKDKTPGEQRTPRSGRPQEQSDRTPQYRGAPQTRRSPDGRPDRSHNPPHTTSTRKSRKQPGVAGTADTGRKAAPPTAPRAEQPYPPEPLGNGKTRRTKPIDPQPRHPGTTSRNPRRTSRPDHPEEP